MVLHITQYTVSQLAVVTQRAKAHFANIYIWRLSARGARERPRFVGRIVNCLDFHCGGRRYAHVRQYNILMRCVDGAPSRVKTPSLRPPFPKDTLEELYDGHASAGWPCAWCAGAPLFDALCRGVTSILTECGRAARVMRIAARHRIKNGPICPEGIWVRASRK